MACWQSFSLASLTAFTLSAADSNGTACFDSANKFSNRVSRASKAAFRCCCSSAMLAVTLPHRWLIAWYAGEQRCIIVNYQFAALHAQPVAN
jgi:hypothetical protein